MDPDATIRETRLRVERSARVALAGGGATPLRETWYALHGYGQLARRFLGRLTGIAGPDRMLVAPEGLSRFYTRHHEDAEGGRLVGASWMTREDRLAEIDDYVGYLDRVAAEVEAATAADVRRTVLGFSQGVHTASRWVVMGGTPATRLILWGASLPPDLPEQAAGVLRGVNVVLVRGAEDSLRGEAEEARDEAWLAAEGVSFEVREHPGGHDIDPELLRELAGD